MTQELKEKYFSIEEKQADYISEELHLKAGKIYRIELKRADGRFYVMFDEDGRPVLLTSGTTAISDGYVDKEKEMALSEWRQKLIQKGINPSEFTRFRQDYGTLLHVCYGELLLGQRIPLGSYSDCNLEEYIRTLNETKKLKFSERSIEYLLSDEVMTELRKDIMSFMQWVKDYNVKPLAIELMGAYPKYKVGSAIDLVCTIDVTEKVEVDTGEVYSRGPRKGEPKMKTQKIVSRKVVVVDFKSGKKGFYKAYVIQLELYKRILMEEFGIEDLYAAYNFAPKEWRTEPSYTFTRQDENKAVKYFDTVMQQGMLRFEDKNKTYSVFSGFADLTGESNAQVITIDILRELYEIYCPELLHELEGGVEEKELVVEKTDIDLDSTAKEVILVDKEEPTVETGEKEVEKSVKATKEAADVTESNEVVEVRTTDVKKEGIKRPTPPAKFEWFKHGSIVILKEGTDMALFKGHLEGNIQTDCFIKEHEGVHYLTLCATPGIGYGYTENFRLATDEEKEKFISMVNLMGFGIGENFEVYHLENKNSRVTHHMTLKVEKNTSEGLSERVEKELAQEKETVVEKELHEVKEEAASPISDSPEIELKPGDFIKSQTKFIKILAILDHVDKYKMVKSKCYWTSENKKFEFPKKAIGGLGPVTNFVKLSDEQRDQFFEHMISKGVPQGQIDKIKGMMNSPHTEPEVTESEFDSLFEEQCDEYDKYIEKQNKSEGPEPILIEVSDEIASIISNLQKKDTPRSRSVYLGKLSWTDMTILYKIVTGVDLDPATSKKQVQDILKEVNYNGYRPTTLQA